jgi:transposase
VGDEPTGGQVPDEVMRALTGLADYQVTGAREDPAEGLVIDVIARRPDAACPSCGVFSARVKSYRLTTVTDAPAQGRRCRLRVTRRAFRCDTALCERRSFTETTTEVPRRARVTARCRAAMGRAGRDRCTVSVAADYGVSWPTAWRAIAAAARSAVAARPTTRAPRRLGLDETRFWWRQPWLTGLVDLDSGEVLDVVEGRTGAAVHGWLDRLEPTDLPRVDVVVTDPHAGYRRAVADRLTTATQVVDRFHVAMLAGRAVTAVRRRRIWEQHDRRGRKIDPAWRARRDLLRRRGRLTERGWRRILAAVRADNGHDGIDGELLWAWAAKEHLADIYDQCRSVDHARRRLWWWYGFVADHPVPELVQLASTLSTWQNELLAYFSTRATNGRTEGTNRIIKHIKRLGFGFTNTHNYRLRILYRCRPLPSNPPATAHPAA